MFSQMVYFKIVTQFLPWAYTLYIEVDIQIADVRNKKFALMNKSKIYCLTLNNRDLLLSDWMEIGKLGQDGNFKPWGQKLNILFKI